MSGQLLAEGARPCGGRLGVTFPGRWSWAGYRVVRVPAELVMGHRDAAVAIVLAALARR